MVYNSVLADIKKCSLNDSDTHNEFHGAEELVFTEWASVTHLLKMKIMFYATLGRSTCVNHVQLGFKECIFGGLKCFPALNLMSCLISEYVIKTNSSIGTKYYLYFWLSIIQYKELLVNWKIAEGVYSCKQNCVCSWTAWLDVVQLSVLDLGIYTPYVAEKNVLEKMYVILVAFDF